MRDRKKPDPPQEPGSPAWMSTFGDLMTNLLTFFVLLFAFSSIDASKAEEILFGLKGMDIVAIPALDPNAPEKMTEKLTGKFIITDYDPEVDEEEDMLDPDDEDQFGNTEDEQGSLFDELYEKIKQHIIQNDLQHILNVEYIDEFTILLRMSDTAFFASGSAALDNEAKFALENVCGILVEHSDLIQRIRIEGNADTVPIGKAGYRDNWELSMDRADSVRRYILSVTELDPSLLMTVYYGEYNPVASNDTEEGRAQNRRVDFVIESKLKGN
ncbi:MAG: OmpA/MotB family protein [Christensenellales bacterium]|jgi:chemotaxis protein MotB